jgi:hypothetical protein
VSVVPEAEAVTRLFSNDFSADSLLGESPSLASVWKVALIAVSWLTVVFEASSIVCISLRSGWSALVSGEFDELLPELSEQSPVPVVLLPVSVVVLPVLLKLLSVLVELVAELSKLVAGLVELLAVVVELFAALVKALATVAKLLEAVVERCET